MSYKRKKATVRKIYLSGKKTWDYEIIGDENWKPKNSKFISKKKLEQIKSSDWFDNLLTFDNISKYKKIEKEKFEKYQKLNDFKKLISLKRYSYLVTTESSFFYFYKKYPSKKIYYFPEKLVDLFDDKPILDRLKYRKPIDLGNMDIEHNLVTFWIFEDAIVFKN